MTRLRQKYKKLKQAFDRRPTKVIRQMSEPHTSVVYRHFLPDQDVALRKDFDFESRVREYAAKVIAEQIIKDGLITVHTDGVFGGTEYRYEVMVVPPFKQIKITIADSEMWV